MGTGGGGGGCVRVNSGGEETEEVLSKGISSLVASNRLLPMANPKHFATPTHILYADDIFVFWRGTKKNIVNLMDLFHSNGEVSDELVWCPASNGVLSLKVVKSFFGSQQPSLSWGRTIWLNISRKCFGGLLGLAPLSTNGFAHGSPGHAGSNDISHDHQGDKLANVGALSRDFFNWWNLIPVFVRKELLRNRLSLSNYRFRQVVVTLIWGWVSFAGILPSSAILSLPQLF
ncbi:hypothetical protein JHK87_052303 [Glycine soja]|nr:hypothetical protein JHK87_052303 [Glycine soja]